MVKGVSIKFKSYEETVPRLLSLIKLGDEIKKHDSIVLKTNLDNGGEQATSPLFVEQVVKYCMENKLPQTEVFIAEGCDGSDTIDIFGSKGYRALAEKYGVGILDLNKAECEETFSKDFISMPSVWYPLILKNSFVISLPKLAKNEKTEFTGALSNMIGAYPARHYKGFFSSRKNKLDSYTLKNQVHNILVCKVPEFALVDASEQGAILAGKPLEIDKQGAKLLGMDWKAISHMKTANEYASQRPEGIEKSA